ncbi:MAG: hypothetical protein ACM3OO_12510 [Planctomycetaceae bacterium]
MTTRSAVRALLVIAVAMSACVNVLAGVAGAGTQTTTPVTLTLFRQTPWTTLKRPELHVAVVASNRGQAQVGRLSATITIGPRFDSLLQYEAALTTGPAYAAYAITIPFKGERLASGSVRTLKFHLDLSTIAAISATDSSVYPMRIDLSSNGMSVASLITPILHIVRAPESQLRFTMYTELQAPVALGPDGVLQDASFPAALGPTGSLGAPVAALREMESDPSTAAPFDLAIQPSLLAQAREMADGFTQADGTQVSAGDPAARTASGFATALTGALSAADVQAVATPYAGPLMPSLLASGLGGDLSRQQEEGAALLAQATGTSPSTQVARPPRGTIDGATLGWLAGRGVSTVLANADTVERPPQPNDFAPPPTAVVHAPNGSPLDLVLPDPSTEALLQREDLLSDPIRAAQAALCELAMIWREEPVPPPQPDGSETIRGLAVDLPTTLPAAVWQPLLDRLAAAPFLRPLHAQDLVSIVNPAGADATLRDMTPIPFSSGYADAIRSLQDSVTAYASMLTQETAVPDQLRRGLFTSEAPAFLAGGEADGQAWLDHVSGVVDTAFAGATPQVDQVFTFTSSEGTIPLRMGDPGPTPLKVSITLQSSQFSFPQGDTQEVVLGRPNQIVTFQVVARAAGQNPIQVIVRSPSGAQISTKTIVVRTTTVNRLALMVTVAAAGGLLLLYVRRWQRRKSGSI